jgi:hypothetical protein
MSVDEILGQWQEEELLKFEDKLSVFAIEGVSQTIPQHFNMRALNEKKSIKWLAHPTYPAPHVQSSRNLKENSVNHTLISQVPNSLQSELHSTHVQSHHPILSKELVGSREQISYLKSGSSSPSTHFICLEFFVLFDECIEKVCITFTHSFSCLKHCFW